LLKRVLGMSPDAGEGNSPSGMNRRISGGGGKNEDNLKLLAGQVRNFNNQGFREK